MTETMRERIAKVLSDCYGEPSGIFYSPEWEAGVSAVFKAFRLPTDTMVAAGLREFKRQCYDEDEDADLIVLFQVMIDEATK